MEQHFSTFAHNIFPPPSISIIESHLHSLPTLKTFFHSWPQQKYPLLQMAGNSDEPNNISLDDLIDDIMFSDSNLPDIMSSSD